MRGLIFCLISAMLALALTANSSYAQTKLNKIRDGLIAVPGFDRIDIGVSMASFIWCIVNRTCWQ